MLVKPAPGRAIRAPGTMQLVPDEGLEVDPSNLFWARALMDEDLVEASAPELPVHEHEPGAPDDHPDAAPIALPEHEGEA